MLSDPDTRVRDYLRDRAPKGTSPGEARRLVGDASNRIYYRVSLGDASLILALMPGAFDPASLPFLDVAGLFRDIGIRIPVIVDVAGEEGILLLEDLGDRMLQDEAEAQDEHRKRDLYRRALEILTELQQKGTGLPPERSIALRTAFDEDKFVFELDFFTEHLLVGLRGRELSSDDREGLVLEFRELATRLAEEPKVLCHRDYHSRNLMVVEDGLAVIDFQDARMGPVSYDLVSLLNDSYLVHEPGFVAEMKDYFCELGGTIDDTAYDLAALQRNLKALGTFGYQIAVCGNLVYRRYLDPTLWMVRDNLGRNPRWDSLRSILARHLDEIA